MRPLILLSLALAFLPLVVFPASDPDTWWHLATGRTILETREIPRADPFSYTAPGSPWVTHEWLFQAAAFSLADRFGVSALILAKAALVFLAFGMAASLAVARGCPPSAAALLALIAAWMGTDRFAERPEIVSLVLFAAFLRVLFDHEDGRADRLPWLPPLTALWANLHSGFVFGLALLGIFLAAAVARRRGVRRLGAIAALCAVASLLNPNGHHALLYPLEILADPHYREVTAEYQPVRLTDFAHHTPAALTWSIVALGVAAAAAARALGRRPPLLEAAVFAVFALAAVQAGRNRALFGLAAIPLLARPLADGAAAFLRGPRAAVLVSAAMLALGLFGISRGVRISTDVWRPVGLGASGAAPREAVEILREAGVSGRLFHEMRFGGYLIWSLFPERKVFLDGRQVLYPREVFDEYVRILGHGADFDSLTAARGIESCLLRNPLVSRNPAGWDPFPPLAGALAEREDWALLGLDDAAVLFVRRSPENAELLARRAFHAVDPFRPSMLAADVDPIAHAERIRKEAQRLAASPSAFPRTVAAVAVARTGDADGALALFEELLDGGERAASREQALAALHELGRSLLGSGRAEDALPYLERLRQAHPGDPEVLSDLGVAHVILGDVERARALWNEVLVRDPDHRGARENLERLPADLPGAGRWRWRRGAEKLTEEEHEAIRKLEAVGYLAGSRPAAEAGGVRVHDPERTAPGWNVYSSGHAPEAYLMDGEGRVLHTWRHDFAASFPDHPGDWHKPDMDCWRRVHLLENGDLLAIHEGLGILKLDAASRLLWARDHAAHHDLHVGPAGEIHVLTRKAHRNRRVDESRPILEDFVTVLDADGALVGELSLLECFENGGVPWREHLERFLETVEERGVAPTPGDLFHTNSIEVLDGRLERRHPAFRSGNLLVSMRHLDMIAVVDPEQERVAWSLPGVFAMQHDPRVTPRGGLLVFDNGWDAPGERSAVIEIDPVSGKILWQYAGSAAAPFYTASCGTAQRLPNGNTLITESDNGRAFEVTEDGDLVWEFFSEHRAGENGRFVATLFEVLRLPEDFPVDWIRTR